MKYKFSDGSLESPHEQQSEHVSRSRTREMEDFHGESSSGHRRVSVFFLPHQIER